MVYCSVSPVWLGIGVEEGRVVLDAAQHARPGFFLSILAFRDAVIVYLLLASLKAIVTRIGQSRLDIGQEKETYC